jgi:hypothetical protein
METINKLETKLDTLNKEIELYNKSIEVSNNYLQELNKAVLTLKYDDTIVPEDTKQFWKDNPELILKAKINTNPIDTAINRHKKDIEKFKVKIKQKELEREEYQETIKGLKMNSSIEECRKQIDLEIKQQTDKLLKKIEDIKLQGEEKKKQCSSKIDTTIIEKAKQLLGENDTDTTNKEALGYSIDKFTIIEEDEKVEEEITEKTFNDFFEETKPAPIIVKERKKEPEVKSKKKEPKIVSLKYQTLDFDKSKLEKDLNDIKRNDKNYESNKSYKFLMLIKEKIEETNSTEIDTLNIIQYLAKPIVSSLSSVTNYEDFLTKVKESLAKFVTNNISKLLDDNNIFVITKGENYNKTLMNVFVEFVFNRVTYTFTEEHLEEMNRQFKEARKDYISLFKG